MFNALNINKALTDNVRVGPNFGMPTTFVLPRIVEISLAYNF